MCTEKTPKWKQWGLNQYLAPLQFLETRHIHFEPCSKRESDTTERLHFHSSLSCIGDGNGNPLQCPCLENPRDGGAWWAAVYGVTQSWTWLMQLSSSSSRQTRYPLWVIPARRSLSFDWLHNGHFPWYCWQASSGWNNKKREVKLSDWKSTITLIYRSYYLSSWF